MKEKAVIDEEEKNRGKKVSEQNNALSRTSFSLKKVDRHKIELEASRNLLFTRKLPTEVEIACAVEIDKERKLIYDEEVKALKVRNPNAPFKPYAPFTHKNVIGSNYALRGDKKYFCIVSDDGRKYFYEPSFEVHSIREKQEQNKTIHSIFISYSRADLSVVQQLEQTLLTNGHSIWRDQESIYGGQQWPKAIGEAIAGNDIVLLAWSQHAAQSHFVEFEWNTALALRKVIIPCLLDDTPLPHSLAAINGIDCKQLDSALPRILQSLQQPIPATNSQHASAVINKLNAIPAAEPEQVLQAAKAIFSQQSWNVQGNVYQAAGDIHVNFSWPLGVALIAGIVAIVVILLNFTAKNIGRDVPSQQEVSTSHLNGMVKNSKGEFLSNLMIVANGTQRDTTYTDSYGGFYFEKIAGKFGDRIRVYVYREGHLLHNEYFALPGPANIVLEEK